MINALPYENIADSAKFVRDMKIMSKNVSWTSEDNKRTIMFTLIPGAISAFAFVSFTKNRHLIDWWNVSRKPLWAPSKPTFYGILDVATVAPLGYASYLVYKYGGGLESSDTKLALAFYGTSLICSFLTIPLVRRMNYLCLFRNTFVMHLAGTAAAYTFYKINRSAGLLLVPYALWTGFYTLLTYSMSKMNTSEASERSAI